MEKILYVNYTMNHGGIESFLMNVIRNIDKKKYDICFLCYSNEKYDYEDEILSLGMKIIKIDNPAKTSLLKHYVQIHNVIKEERPDIVHCNTYFDSGYVMLASKINNVRKRITHSHTTQGNNKVKILQRIKWNIGRFLINLFSTNKIACSKESGEALFNNKNFAIVTNRNEYRKISI